MAKEITITLSREAWNELEEIRKEAEEYMPDFLKEKDRPKTYEEYLAEEEKYPTHALFG